MEILVKLNAMDAVKQGAIFKDFAKNLNALMELLDLNAMKLVTVEKIQIV
jgi:hypothetical protein